MHPLTAEQERRAADLHEEAIVIDTQGGPSVYTADMIKLIDERLAAGHSLEQVQLAMADAFGDVILENEPEWLQAWQASGLTGASITADPSGPQEKEFAAAVQSVAAWILAFDRAKHLTKVCSAADLEASAQAGRFAVILNFQDPSCVGRDLDNFDLFYHLGIRIMQLTYNDLTLFGCGCTERTDCGLSKLGVKAVARMNKLGMAIDLSHTGKRTALDVIAASDTPVMISHAGCAAVHEHDRGKSDEELESLARKDGFLGICLVPAILTEAPAPSLDHFLDHLDHAVRIMGADKVGIGTDWGMGDMPQSMARKLNEDYLSTLGLEARHGVDFMQEIQGYRGWTDWPNITRGLVSRSYSDPEIRGFLGESFLRFFRTVAG
ncbi:MAG: membrane dipeptidase [Candidatus Schekmanbacteria bacterium]|nr:membrane dipeptidase [Candidatus Schekmanbacteria bacterium]